MYVGPCQQPGGQQLSQFLIFFYHDDKSPLTFFPFGGTEGGGESGAGGPWGMGN